MNERLRLYGRLFFTEALRALARHKGRTALTALGSMIGVGTMIWVVAVGEAGKARAEEELHNLGDNLVWIEAGSRNVNGVRTGTHGTSTLTPEDAEAVRREVPLLKSVAENVDGSVQIVTGNRNWNTRYRGVSPEYLDIKRWRMAEGAFLSDDHVRRMDNVAVLGETVCQRVFGPVSPIGKLIRVNNMVFQVIGVLAPKGQTGSGQDQDDTIMMPRRRSVDATTTSSTTFSARPCRWRQSTRPSTPRRRSSGNATTSVPARTTISTFAAPTRSSRRLSRQAARFRFSSSRSRQSRYSSAASES
jgi:hypothetical protein